MDLDMRRIAVGVVGFSMAVVGLFLSIVAPAVTTVIPHMQTQMPALAAQAQHRRRIAPRKRNSEMSENATSSATGSADSVVTSSEGTTQGSPSSEGGRMALPIANDVQVVAQPIILPAASAPANTSTSNSCSPRACIARVRRMHSSRKRSGSTSTTDSSSSERVQHKASLTALATPPHLSPSPSISNFTAHSSSDVDVHSSQTHVESSSTVHPDHHQRLPSADADQIPAPRPLGRARTLFQLHRVPKRSKLLSRRETAPGQVHQSSSTAQASTSVVVNPDSEPESASLTVPSAHQNQEEASGAGFARTSASDTIRRSKSSPGSTSYFAKLRGKGKKKAVVENDAIEIEKETEHKKGRAKEVASEANEKRAGAHSEGEEKGKSGKRSLCPQARSQSRRRPESMNLPPPRTRPYEMYNFPTPISPDAFDYVRLTRSEFRHGSSSPPAAPAHEPHAADPVPTSPSPSRQTSTSSVQPSLQSAPAHHVEFAPQIAPPKRTHIRSSSLTSSLTMSVADELGFALLPASTRSSAPQKASGLRNELRKAPRPKSFSGKGTVNGTFEPETTSSQPHRPPRPILKRSGLTL